MTTNSDHTKNKGRMDPMLEALIKELLDKPSRPNIAKDPIMAALTEELMSSFDPSAPSSSQMSPVETALLAASLAPALAEALAPVLAEALAPALVKALDTLVSPKKIDQEAGAKKDTAKQK